MSERALQIIVKARDEASQTFNKVGESAGGLAGTFGKLNEIAEAGHGLHKQLRVMHNILLAAQVLPVAIDAVKAVFATLGGSAEQAAEGQRKLFDTIKEFPIVGKHLAEAAEWASSKLAHAFGKESTADIEAEVKKKKEALEEFAKDVKKLSAETTKTNDEAALSGLLPSEQAVEKAKQKYKQRLDELAEYKKSALAAAAAREDTDAQEIRTLKHTINDKDTGAEDREAAQKRLDELQLRSADSVKQQIEKIATETEAAKKIEAQAIAEANAKALADEREFSTKLADEAQQRADKLKEIDEKAHEQQLEADNRAYEAKQAKLQDALDKELQTIKEAVAKENAERQKQIDELLPKAQAGDEAARQKISQLAGANIAADQQSGLEAIAARNAAAQDASANRDAQLRDARLSALKLEADSGNELAKQQLERLNSTREQEATENALVAIYNDEKSTTAQKAEAQRQYNALKAAEVDHATNAAKVDALHEADASLEILAKEAAFGDLAAQAKLKQLELERQTTEERKQLVALSQSETASEETKLKAKEDIARLDALATKQGNFDAKEANQDATLFALQQEAALGDKLAEQQLKKIELAKQYAGEREKLNQVINGNADADAKAQAKSLLASLDAQEAKTEAQAGVKKLSDKQDNTLASLNNSFFETGVAARAEQEHAEFEPVVNAQNGTTAAVNDLGNKLIDFFKNQGKPTQKVLT